MKIHLTDRIAGLFLLIFAVAYTWQASTLKSSLPADPLGPGAFPLILGILLAICSVWMILRPDPNPTWPPVASWVQMSIIIGSLVVYANIMRPVGFVIATALEMIVLALIFKGPPVKSLLASLGTALFLYFLFDYGLALNLPNGLLPF
ncbi:MAG: tripartite tricarboxylate transporter TctB family protein [Caldilineaceae bacterium]